jgi:hypothetical protein
MGGNGFGSRGRARRAYEQYGITEDVPDARALWDSTLSSRRADIALGKTSSLLSTAHRPSRAYWLPRNLLERMKVGALYRNALWLSSANEAHLK